MDNSPNNSPLQKTPWTAVNIAAITILGIMAVTLAAYNIVYLVNSRKNKAARAKEHSKSATYNRKNDDVESAISSHSHQPNANSFDAGNQVQRAHAPRIETDTASTDGIFVVGSPTCSESGDDADDNASWAGDFHGNGGDIELHTLTPALPVTVASPRNKEIKTITVTLRDRSPSSISPPYQQTTAGKSGESERSRPANQYEKSSSSPKLGHISRLFGGRLSKPETPISHIFDPSQSQKLNGPYKGNGNYVRAGRADRRVGGPMVAKPVVLRSLSAVVVSPDVEGGGGGSYEGKTS